MKKAKNNKKATTRAANTKSTNKGQPNLFDKAKVQKRQNGPSDGRKVTPTTPTVVAEPVKMGRGGLKDYKESKSPSVQRVRGEFLSDTFKPKITFSFNTVTFNTACVNLFPGCQYVSFSIDLENLRLIVEPETDYDKNGLKFANFKDGRNVPRTCRTKYFCLMLYDLMKWNPNAKYRILTVFQQFDDKKIMVFNLDEAQQVFSELVATEDGKKKRNTTVNMPSDWKDRFGYTMEELDEKTRIDFSNKLVIIDPKTGEKQFGITASKPPTAEELIHEPYGGIRPQKKESKK